MLAIAMSLVALSVNAQFYSTGDDPMRIRWQQIETGRYRIIFDKDMEPWAARLSDMMDSIAGTDAMSLGHTPKRIDILLHSHIAYSNGLVSWAPRRLEMYTYGQADGDCVPWMTHLAMHEYRHVVQTSMLKRGFTRLLYGLFGEQAIGAVLGVYVPLWLMEGDAVANETSLTNGGRGRQAQFEQEMRAPVVQGKTPTYDQAYNGSYRRYVPDYYHMGYLTVSNVRAKYGPHIWRNAMETVGSKSYSLTPFNRSLRHDTGLDKVDLYEEAMDDWHKRWDSQDSQVVATPYTTILDTRDDYAEHTSARMTSSGLIAFRTSLDNLPQIVDHSGNVITTPSPRYEKELTTHGDTIVWCERKPHPRWKNAGENRVMMIRTDGTGRHEIARGMYSTPAISADGQQIAVVETQKDGSQQIVVMDFDGTIVKKHDIGPWTQATSICWHGDDIAYIALTDNGKSIVAQSADSRQTTLLKAAYNNLRHITSDGQSIYYTSDATGIENIYRLGTGNTTERITSARFGAAWPMVSHDTLYYSNYTDKGYSIVATPLSTRATDNPPSPMADMAEKLTDMERTTTAMLADTTNITSRPYNKLSHLFRIHSWGPIVVNAEENTASAGLAISSQNTFGNSIFTAGANWSNDTENRYFARYTYSGFMPKISLSAHWGYIDHKLNAIRTLSEEEADGHYSFEGIHYYYDSRQRTQHYKANISLPLTYYNGAWVAAIRPVIASEYYNNSAISIARQQITIKDGERQMGNVETSKIYRENYGTIGYELHAQTTRRQAYRDIGCRRGIAVAIGYRHSIGEQDYGSMRYGSAIIYLPGIARHHNITIQASHQDKQEGETRERLTGDEYRLLLGDAIGIARGTHRIRNSKMTLIRANYTMPLVCPDWSLGPVCYIKRINGRLFFDYEKLRIAPYVTTPTRQAREFKSVGLETWIESHWLRLPYLISLGYRGTIVNGSDFMGEMLFGINIK